MPDDRPTLADLKRSAVEAFESWLEDNPDASGSERASALAGTAEYLADCDTETLLYVALSDLSLMTYEVDPGLTDGTPQSVLTIALYEELKDALYSYCDEHDISVSDEGESDEEDDDAE